MCTSNSIQYMDKKKEDKDVQLCGNLRFLYNYMSQKKNVVVVSRHKWDQTIQT